MLFHLPSRRRSFQRGPVLEAEVRKAASGYHCLHQQDVVVYTTTREVVAVVQASRNTSLLNHSVA